MFIKSRIISLALILAASSIFAISCGKTGTQTTDKPKEEKNQTTQTQVADTKSNSNTEVSAKNTEDVSVVKLTSMQCNTCKKNITKALKKVDGISDFDINVDGKVAKIKYDKSKTDLSKIENAITAAGYDANDKKADPTAYENLDDCCKLPKDRK